MTSELSTCFGFKWKFVAGKIDRNWRLIINSAGDFKLFIGVFLYSSIASRGEVPSSLHLVRIFFMVCTVFSARPFD